MIDYGKDYEYANSRLNSSYVMHKGKCVLVESVYNNGLCFVRDAITTQGWEVPLEELDVTPVRIGYVNTPTKANWVSRVPSRHYRQGFRVNNLVTQGGVRIRTIGSEIIKAISNVYPSLSDTIDMLMNGERQSGAFAKDLSLDEQMRLSYKGKMVGRVDTKKETVMVDNKYQYMTEVLEGYF